MADVLITVGIDPKVDYSDFKKGVNDLVAGISASTKPVKIKVELDDTSVAKIKQELSTIHQLAATASKGGVGLSSSSKRAPKTSMARSLDAEKRSIEANIKAKQEYIRMTQQMGMADNAEAQAKKAAAKAQSEFITDVKEQNKELKKLQTARNNIVRDLKKNAAKNDTGDAGKAYAKLSDYKPELDLLEGQLLDRSITREKYNKTIEDIINGEKVASKAIRDAGKDYQTLGSRFGGLVKKFTTWLSVSQGVMYAVNSVKKMAQETIKVDTAMTELKKVTDETDASYERFLTSATSRSKKLGSSLSDTISATADFARLGYSIEEDVYKRQFLMGNQQPSSE